MHDNPPKTFEDAKIEIWVDSFNPTDFFGKSLIQTANRTNLTNYATIHALNTRNVFFSLKANQQIQIQSTTGGISVNEQHQPQISSRTIRIACGDTAYQELTKSPTASTDSDHCYVLAQSANEFIIPALSHRDIFKDPANLHWLEHAFRKALNLTTRRDIESEVKTIIRPSLNIVLDYIELAKQTPVIAVDLETLTTNFEPTCFGIALSPTEAISIPFAGQFLAPLWSDHEELQIWQAIQSLLLSPNLKIFHNYIFDTLVLNNIGLKINPNLDDTLIRANYLNPLLPKGLKDVARIYLYCAPWKDVKDFNLTGDVDHFYRYNALDAARTLHVYQKQEEELDYRKLKSAYSKVTKPLFPLVYDTCVNGINVDNDKLAVLGQQLDTLLNPIRTTLCSIGDPLISKGIKKKELRDKSNDKIVEGTLVKAYKIVEEQVERNFNPASPKQVKEILETLGYKLPSKKGKESSDREALLKLNRKQPHTFITNMLRFTKLQKLKSSYADIVLDADKKCRFTYKIAGTISGRFSCEKTLFDTGLNIQTLPRETEINIKSIFIPRDPGEVLLEVDLSQAELRVVAWLANEHKLIKLLSEGVDIHQYVADSVTKLTGITCPRNLGKRIGHAKNYGMGPYKFVDSCLIEADIEINVSDAVKLLNAHSATFPAIAMWQSGIRSQLERTRLLEAPTGRQCYFYGPVTDEMHRQALSFIPQATVVDTINLAWIKLSELDNYKTDFVVHAQIHDSLLFSVKSDKLELVKKAINEVFNSISWPINNVMRHIPHDFKVGNSWGSMESLK